MGRVDVRLVDVENNSRVRVVKINLPRGWVERLASIGVREGSVIMVESNDRRFPWSPIVVVVEGVKAVIDRRMAKDILVEVLD
ncbi:MAG: ferrous iron transport protein A [Desulfurococcales archaeon]|nr:ferrous iron transport protein A [Desulfurococcales archaeon]